MIKYFIGIIFFINILSLKAQNKPFVFFGSVHDELSANPIKYVHFIIHKDEGFISDGNGMFNYLSELDSLRVSLSCIGYQSKSVTLFKNKHNTVYLQPSAFQMNEVVVVQSNSPVNLLTEMIHNIKINYPIVSEQIIGLTREEIYLDSLNSPQNYKSTVKVLVDKFPYSQKNTFGNIKILEKNIEWNLSERLDLKFYAGVHNIHRFDYVMNKKGILNLEKIKDFDVKILDTILYINEKVILLDYQNDVVKGKLYVMEESKALIRMEQEKINSGLEDFLFALRPFQPFQRIYHKVFVEYEKHTDNKWRMKSIRYDTKFQNKRDASTIILNNTFSTLDHKPMEGKIPLVERFNFNEILSDNILITNSNSAFENKNILSTIANRLDFQFNLGIIPTQSNSYNFLPQITKSERVFNATKRYSEKIFSMRYLYQLKNNMKAIYTFGRSTEENFYTENSAGIIRNFEIGARGIWNFGINFSVGHRQIKQAALTEKFTEPFTIKNKEFDSFSYSYLLSQKEWFVSPGIALSYKVSEKFKFNISTHYYSPITVNHKLFLVENEEYWFWNRKKISIDGELQYNSDKIYESNMIFLLVLQFKY